MAAPTPGPWEISIAGGCTIMGNDGLVPVAQPYIFRDEPALTEANARLIAAAPTMYDELKRLAESFGWTAEHPAVRILEGIDAYS